MSACIVPCPNCDDPVALNVNGWGRCRSCGHETLRDSQPCDRYEQAYVLASIDFDSASDERGEAAPALGLSLK